MECQVLRVSEGLQAPRVTMEHLEPTERQDLVETLVSLEQQGLQGFLVPVVH